MARLLFPRALCVALVLLVLSSSALLASGGRQRQPVPKPESFVFLSHAWSELVSLMTQLGLPVNAAGDNGSTMDPNGSATLQSDHPRPGHRANADIGSEMDPDGKK